MAKTIEDLQDTETVEIVQSPVTGAKAVIDNTWSVLSFVLGSEASWLGYDTDEI